jgi:hypothetical protein
MLQPDVYWLREVEGVRLAIMPRPRSGEWLADEISGYQRSRGLARRHRFYFTNFALTP